MREQIEASKADVAESLSPQQRMEAERKAAEWLSSTKKRSGFAEVANQASKSKIAVVFYRGLDSGTFHRPMPV